jgi:hypothetical protein
MRSLAVKDFLHLFDQVRLNPNPMRVTLPLSGKLAENFLRLGQIVFGLRFVVRL